LMRLSYAGNLGLGVTPSAWSGNWKAIQLNGGSLFSYLTSEIHVGQNFYNSTSAISNYLSNGYATDYWQYNGQHIWMTAPSGTAGNAITFTQAMTLTANGRLLLGTTTEGTNLLDVNGTGRFVGTGLNDINLQVGNSGTNTAGNTAKILFYPSGSYTGTNAPGIIYTIESSATYDVSTKIQTYKSGSGVINALTLASTGAATFSSSVQVNGGTANNTLNVYDTNNAGISLQTSYTGTTGSDGFYIGQLFQSTNFLFRQRENADIIFDTNSTERLRITSGGNLLVGSTSDNGNKLQVYGNTYTEGIYNATGSFSQGASTTSTFYTFNNSATNRVFLITLRQQGASANTVIAIGFTYSGVLAAYNIAQENTNPALYLTITSTGGLGLQLTTGSGYGTTTWEWTITQIK